MTSNNSSTICGTITAIEKFYATSFGSFQKIWLLVPRFSGRIDQLPVVASEKITLPLRLGIGDHICAEGDLRSTNLDEPRSLFVHVFAKCITKLQEFSLLDNNCVQMEGYLCEKPKLRQNPDGKQNSEFMLANNRGYGKSSYIPVISWDNDAKLCAALNPGDKISLCGRFQSRIFYKRNEERLALELSAQQIKPV